MLKNATALNYVFGWPYMIFITSVLQKMSAAHVKMQVSQKF